MTEKWEAYKETLDVMSDEAVERSAQNSIVTIDAHTEWLEAIASWVAAGRPRTKPEQKEPE